jgi:hypothetical protein
MQSARSFVQPLVRTDVRPLATHCHPEGARFGAIFRSGVVRWADSVWTSGEGSFGDDVLYVGDRIRDRVGGGVGHDRAHVDPIDAVWSIEASSSSAELDRLDA